MRRFVIVTNKQDFILDQYKLIEMNIEDLEVVFNDDVLNVMTEEKYEEVKSSKYMYGVEVDMKNYLKDFRNFLSAVVTADSEIECIFDASIKRYINKHELNYFANNKLLPSKLFNIEINQESGCEYKTIGLESIGLKEFIFKTNMYLNEEDFQIFKTVVTNFVIGKRAKVNINGSYIDYAIGEDGDGYRFNYIRPKKIFDFYFRNDKYLDDIRYDLIKYHWPRFCELYRTHKDMGQFIVNKAKIHAIEEFDVLHVEEFVIVCDGINYNQDNLFYADRYK